MNDKEWVKLEYAHCAVCFKLHNHNCGILLHKFMRDIKGNGPNDECITNDGLCEDCEKLYKQNYVALIETTSSNQDTLQENRTGRIIHVLRKVFERMINTELTDSPLMFIDVATGDNFHKIQVKH